MGPRAWLILGFICAGIDTVVHTHDLVVADCRIKGVAIVKNKEDKIGLNYTTAGTVCQQLGLTLANKAHMEVALNNGLETCSFGWVSDGIAVVPRIHRNERCGQNKTGVVPWPAEKKRGFSAYCFNSSDIWINSCKPDPVTRATPRLSQLQNFSTPVFHSVTERATSTAKVKTATETKPTVEEHQRNSTHMPFTSKRTAIPKLFTTAHTTPSPLLNGLTTAESKALPTTPTTPSSSQTKLTTTESDEETENSQRALKSDPVIFGGIPITLLVLALVFFVAAVSLAVCYVRKYRTTLPVTSPAKKQDNVEVKVLKETKPKTTPSKEESKQNGSSTDAPKSTPAENTAKADAETTVKQVTRKTAEAEV